MNVMRQIEIKVDKFLVGDKIQIGEYTATCQKAGKKKALFFLDWYLDKTYPMDADDHNDGGYEASPLRRELQGDGVLDIFEAVRESMVPFKTGDLIRIPYAEELFGDANDYKVRFISSGKKQLPLMRDRVNRVAKKRGAEFETGWIMNKVEGHPYEFGYVDSYGYPGCTFSAWSSYGIRPVFRLRQPGTLMDEIAVSGLETEKIQCL